MLVSVGDATLKFWRLDSSSSLTLAFDHTLDQANGFDSDQTSLIVFGDDRKVQTRTMKLNGNSVIMDEPELATQFNSTVRRVKYCSKYIAASAEDGFCHVMDTASKTVKKYPKNGHEGVVKNFAIDPLYEFIATIGCDGTLIVSSLKNDIVAAKVPKVGKNTQVDSA